MFNGDRRWALFAVLILWFIYAFVFWKVLPTTTDQGVTLALAISGALVLLFNTAAILTMISHYDDDKDHIYGLDIHYLDALKGGKE